MSHQIVSKGLSAWVSRQDWKKMRLHWGSKTEAKFTGLV